MADLVLAIVGSLLGKAKREVSYLSRFNSYIEEFEHNKSRLAAKRDDVLKDIEYAKKRNETQVDYEVLHWLKEADSIIEEDIETRKKCFFGWCPNCFWKYRRGKMLKGRMMDIAELMERSYFDRVAREGRLPGIKYYPSHNFIDFESRKSELQKLVKALEDEKCSMIGLYGMGGTGKTTLAMHLGKQVENSKAFERVIFVVVSSRPDFTKIQAQIARSLGLELREDREEEHSKMLWSRIVNNEEKILIILDDMWEEINLQNIGIPYGSNHRNCCVLITTRLLKVCKAMSCQHTIGLQTLTDQDALNLFLEHVGTRSDDSFNETMHYAQELVHKCGGLPIAVVAIAKTLRNWPLSDWNIALETLQRSEPLLNVDEDMRVVYYCLGLSYDQLEECTKDVFLLCSLFPEGYEIPIDLLCKLCIGLGLFGEAHNYLASKVHAIRVKNILITSSLLFEAKEVYLKMHSLVREMALWVSRKDLQAIMDSNATVKPQLRFLSWSSRNDFPNQLDGTKLEILVLRIKGKAKVEESYKIFEEVERLRVLLLHCDSDDKYIPLSLRLLHPVRNIRTLILDGWKLGDLSALQNLHDLEIIELTNCLINELPSEIGELKNLRSLGLRKCRIERNNPFEVIAKCIKLEELDFVLNSTNIEDWKEGERDNLDKVVRDISLVTLRRYSIACPHLKYFEHDYNGMINCFNTENVKNLFSNATFKNFVRKAQVLELGKISDAGWKSLVPDIIPVEEGGMNDLIKLCLYSLVDMECLVETGNYDHDSEVAVFSKLVELYLDSVDVKELYRGRVISGFLERLEILRLRNCKKLRNIFFDSSLKLPQLKVLHLINCPMFRSSIFQSSVAQSLEKLEELTISDFEELERIITYERLGEEIQVDVDNKNSYRPLFPNLRTLEIKGCGKLELISPLLYAEDLPLLESLIIRKCEGLKYIFGEYRAHESQALHQVIMLSSLTKMVLDDVPNFITTFQECNIDMERPEAPILKDDSEEKYNTITARRSAFSWAHVCCFLPRIKDNNIVSSNTTLEDHASSTELPVSTEEIQTFHTAKGLLRGPLKLRNIRQMTIVQCSNLMSLFTVSIAKTVMLEKLTIQRCHKLKHVITNEEQDDDKVYSLSIFPNLEELLIVDCGNMEFIFSSTFSVRLEKLKFLIIGAAPKLKYVFGRFGGEEYLSIEIENKELYVDLPALETLSLTDVPNIISICSNGRQLNLEMAKESQTSMKEIQTFHSAQDLLREPLKLQNIRQMTIVQCSNLMSLFTVSIAKTVMLEKLTIQRCNKLKHIIANEGEDHDHIDCISIFPKLEELLIVECRNMKSIFPSTSSVCLQKLKFVIIKAAPKLEYVFERFGRQELSIGLPSLEMISLTDVPNVIGICTNRRQMSLETAKNLTTSQGAAESEIEEITRVERPMTSSINSNVLNFHNLREMKIIKCRKVNVIFTASTWRSLPQMSRLCILNCEELVHVVDEDSSDYDRFRDNYILPELEYFQIQDCKKLEFIFPSSFLGGLPKLKSMIVEKAANLKYIFGDYSTNENENGRFKVNLPALETISLRDVPNIINICAKRHSVMLPSLRKVCLDKCQELTRDSPNLMVYWKPAQDAMEISMSEKKLTNLEVGNSTIDEVFNLEGVKSGGLVRLSLQAMVLKNLSELKQICKGPKSNLSFYHLSSLKVVRCKMLRVIFSNTIMKSLPNLSHLKIKDCEELVHIIEEDPKENADDDWLERSFPQLEKVHIHSCHSLKYLFSISTPNMFPKLERLEIEEASELEQIFKCKQDDTHKMMKDAIPSLSYLRLKKLPKLATIGWGIEFQTLPDHQVVDCPEYQETTSQQVQQEPENLDLDNQAATHQEPLSPHSNNVQEKSSLPNSAEELKDEHTMKQPTGQLQHQDLGETKTTIVVPEITNVPLDDEDLKKTKPTCETIMTHQQEQGEISAISVIENNPRETGIIGPKLHASTFYSEVGSSQSSPCTITDKETGKEIDKAVPSSKFPTAETSQDFEVVGLKETEERGFHQEHHKSKDIASIQPRGFGLTTQSELSLDKSLAKELSQNSETRKEVVGIATASDASVTPASSNSKVDSMKETVGQSFQEHDTCPVEATKATQSDELEAGNQSMVSSVTDKSSKTGKEAAGILLASQQSSMSTTSTNSETTKEAARESVDTSPMVDTPFDSTIVQTGHASVQGEQKSENASKLNPPNVIPSLYHQSSQIGTASPSPTSEILEIFQLVDLKDGEAALLAQALKQHPQLLLPREQRTQRRIAFSYRVLVDILLILANKSPCTITTSEKSTLEDNLCEATSLGFNKGWVDSVRAKVFDVDMSDVSSAQEKIRAMEAELETFDMMLKQVQKQKQEARRDLEKAQSKFDEIDAKLLGLLEDRKTLMANMTNFKNIISVKDTSFGI